MAIKKVEGEMLDQENKMMEKFRKERENLAEEKGNITFTMIKPEAASVLSSSSSSSYKNPIRGRGCCLPLIF